MKTSATSLFVLLLFLAPAAHSATTVSCDRLDAGTGNSFGTQSTVSGMLAVGHNNMVSSEGGASMGFYNEVTARNSLAVGMFNDVIGYTTFDSGLIASGYGNMVYGANSVAIGQNNTMSSDWEAGGSWGSLVVGYFNHCLGNNSIMTGSGNQIPTVFDQTDGDVHAPEAVALHGTGLICRHDNCMVVGKNNVSVEPTVPPSTPSPLFVVGNGGSASARSNAFEVRDNGDIIISKPQGDISMGIYGD